MPVKKKNLLTCTRCGKDAPPSTFYSSKNPKNGYLEKIPICKDCINEIYNDIYSNVLDRRQSIVRLCSILDVPFSDRMLEMAMNQFLNNDKDVTEYKLAQLYMSKINSSVGKNQGSMFSDSESFPNIFTGGSEDYEELKYQNKKLEDSEADLNSRISELVDENSSLESEIENLNAKLSASKDKYLELESKNSQLRETNLKLNSNVAEITEANKQLNISNKQLSKDLDIFKNDSYSLQSKLTSTEGKLESANLSIQDEQSRRKNSEFQLKNKITEIAADKDSLSADYLALKKELLQVREELSLTEKDRRAIEAELKEVKESLTSLEEKNIVVEDENIPEDYVFEWGGGFTLNEYEWLNKELSVWYSSHDNDTEAQKTLLHMIVVKKLIIRKKLSGNEDISKEEKSLQEMMLNAKKIEKEKDQNDNVFQDAFGVWLSHIEDNEPAEWIEDKKKYKDIDGIDAYIKKYVVRPLKNFVTGSRDFDPGMDLLSGDAQSND